MAGTRGHSGGTRVGAGRKSNTEIRLAREILDTFITDADWQGIFAALVKAAKEADVRAAQLLLAYRFGLPTQNISADEEAPPIRIIHVEYGRYRRDSGQ